MSIITELKEIERFHIATVILLFFGIIAPGFLTVFLFRPELVEGYDVLKLFLFAISLTLPLALMNTIAFVAHREDHSVEPLHLGCIITAVELYLLLYVSYVFTLRFRTFSYIVTGAEILLFIVSLAWYTAKDRKKNASNKGAERTGDPQGGSPAAHP